jgi:hypothetical protein
MLTGGGPTVSPGGTSRREPAARTTICYDIARANLDRHAAHSVAAYLAGMPSADRCFWPHGASTPLHPGGWSGRFVYRTMVNDAIRAMTGPGGHRGTSPKSSVAGSHPHTDSSDQSLPGPATTEPTTDLPAAS